MPDKIGFVGVGTMGRPMAHNLLRAGFTVSICPHTNLAPVQELEASGAAVVANPRAVAAASEVVITCLPNAPQVEEVLFGPEGILAGARPGTILIDSSTISPVASRDFAARVAEAGCTFLDAPVSGGESGAIAGKLTFMVGGDAAALDAVRDVLGAMGQKVFHVGGSGTGTVVKLCNNMVLAINMLGVCEAFTMGAKSGVEATKIAEVLIASSGASAFIERTLPKTILANQYKPGFMLKLMCKDMHLALDACAEAGVPTFTGSAAAAVMDMVRNMGKGDDDFTVVATLFEDVAGVSIGGNADEERPE